MESRPQATTDTLSDPKCVSSKRDHTNSRSGATVRSLNDMETLMLVAVLNDAIAHPLTHIALPSYSKVFGG